MVNPVVVAILGALSCVALILVIALFVYCTNKATQLTLKLTTLAAAQVALEKELRTTQAVDTSLTKMTHADSEAIVAAKLANMTYVNQLAEELITHSAELFRVSQLIIQSTQLIKKNLATKETHQEKASNLNVYTHALEQLKIVLAKIRLNLFDDLQNTAILANLRKIELLTKSEYEAQIRADMSRHDFLVEEYERYIDEFVAIIRELTTDEWHTLAT